MKVYDGGTWIAASAASQAIMVEYEYTATAGQTTFTGADDNALTLSYTAGSIIVTLNGVVLDASDYTASNGNSVVLAVGASAGDELNVRAFSTFDIANTYTQAQIDTALATKLGTGAGAVGTANIADSAVTDAKIAAMAAAKLTGRVPAANVNLGGVLQVVTSTPLAVDVTTTTNTQLWAKTVTPKSSSSVFYVFSSWNTRNTCAISGFINGAVVNSASGRGTTGSGMLQNYSDHNQQSFHWAYTNSSLSDIVFSERLQQAGADATAEVWNYGYMFSIIIEVAA
jgi:hypothetical protein